MQLSISIRQECSYCNGSFQFGSVGHAQRLRTAKFELTELSWPPASTKKASLTSKYTCGNCHPSPRVIRRILFIPDYALPSYGPLRTCWSSITFEMNYFTQRSVDFYLKLLDASAEWKWLFNKTQERKKAFISSSIYVESCWTEITSWIARSFIFRLGTRVH